MLANVMQSGPLISSQDRIRDFVVENIRIRKKSNNPKQKYRKVKNDAFGTICFQGFGQDASTNAPYVKVSAIEAESRSEDDLEIVEKVWELMADYWNMRPPKLIISVTGGAKSFYMKNRLLNNFKRGLMKAATSSDAWIVTGGTKTGVMEIVGEAVRDYNLQNGSSRQPIVVVGIATWGIVANRERLRDKNNNGYFPCYYNIHEIDPTDKDSAPLDSNHTHFILVDNGKKGADAFGGETGFRAQLENYSCRSQTGQAVSKSIPVVLLVVEGGKNTLKTASEAIEQSTPVVVIEGSGRAADFIAYASKLRLADKSSDKKLWDVAKELLKPTPEKEQEHNEECLKYVKNILREDRKNLITIIKQEEEESGENIDQAIINSLIKASGGDTENQLDLALSWNRHDIARNEIFSMEKRAFWTQIDLNEAMHRALIEDKDEFVTLFLDSGLDLRDFLTIKRLNRLYHDALEDPTAPPVVCLLGNLVREVMHSYWLCGSSHEDGHKFPPNILRYVGQVINNLSQDQRDNVYQARKYDLAANGGEVNASFTRDSVDGDDKDLITETTPQKTGSNLGATDADVSEEGPSQSNKQRGEFEYTERELFLWCLLLNRRKLAEIFWRLGQDHISCALTASMLLKALSEAADEEEELDLAQDLLKNAQDFEHMAEGVLNACYQKDKPMSHELLIRELDQWGKKTLFLLADAGRQMDFMEHTCCQTKLNKNWKGKMALYTPMWQIILGLLLPFLAVPLIKFTDDYTPESSSNNDVHPTSEGKDSGGLAPSKKRPRRTTNFFAALYYYETAPVVKFCYHTISFVIFLGLFSYFMLTDLYPYDPAVPGYHPSIAEYIVYGWVLTMWIEELRQIYSNEPKSYLKKLQAYFSSSWNRFDQTINLLFLTSVILRFSLPIDEFVWARMFYTVTLSLYYIRFLQVFYVEKNIGPKVVMIRQMVVDLLFFLMLLAVFLISYGVAQQVLLYPNEQKNWNVLYGVVYEPYFSIYGQFNLDELQGDVPGCSSNATIYEDSDLGIPRCPENSWLVMVLFSIYLILTNILLINLLIAMFSYTFSNVQENSEKVWRFYRYGLIKEYFAKPTLAPPLIIFSHIYRGVRTIIRYCRKQKKLIKNDFKQQFSTDHSRHLAEFERSGMFDYYQEKKVVQQEGLDYKLTNNSLRIDRMLIDVEFLRESAFSRYERMQEKAAGGGGSKNVQSMVPIAVEDQMSARDRVDRDHEIGDIHRKLSNLEDQMDALLGMMKKLTTTGTSVTPLTRQGFPTTRVNASPVGMHQIEIRNFDHGVSDS